MKDIQGQRFGKIVVSYQDTAPRRRKTIFWMCQCDCGKTKSIEGSALRSGHTKSCGCYRPKRGGFSRTGTYQTWKAVLKRCNPEKSHNAMYVARGMCDRWYNYSNFVADMGERPDGTTIDRIDNSKGYEPSNCRWATWEQQCYNKTNNRILTLNGESLPMKKWADRLGMSIQTLSNRINEYGWTVERALTQTVRFRPHHQLPK